MASRRDWDSKHDHCARIGFCRLTEEQQLNTWTCCGSVDGSNSAPAGNCTSCDISNLWWEIVNPEVFPNFVSSRQTSGIVPQTRPVPLPSTSLPFHCSLCSYNLAAYAIYPELITSLNTLQIKSGEFRGVLHLSSLWLVSWLLLGEQQCCPSSVGHLTEHSSIAASFSRILIPVCGLPMPFDCKQNKRFLPSWQMHINITFWALGLSLLEE
jgi:hypothetical protein